MTLLAYIDPPLARRSDPTTSHRAAQSMRNVVAGQRKAILRALVLHGGLNHAELDEVLQWRNNTAVRRLAGLFRTGLIEKAGERPTPTTGRAAQVYMITSLGKQLLREGSL